MCNSDGTFEFRFKLIGGEKSGIYLIKIGGWDVDKSAQQYFEFSTTTDENKFMTGNINFDVKNYIPTISGTLQCFANSDCEIFVCSDDNSFVFNEDISSDEGILNFSCELPSLLYPKDYELVISTYNQSKQLLTIMLDISSSIITVSMSGSIDVGGNVRVEGELSSTSIEELNGNFNFTDYHEFSFTLPNLLINLSCNMTFDCYEEVDNIIDVSVHNNMTLECYAFMVTRGEQHANLEIDVNINNYYPKSQDELPGIMSYEQADMGGQLSGTTDAPYLVSGDIDLEDRSNYRLLLTGYDAPLINEGEKSGLKYNGENVTAHNYGENCTNFSVIYKLNIKNFSGGKMILEYSPYTNPNYYIDKENGLYVSAYVKNSKYYTANLLIAKRQTELEFELEQGANEIYLVVSGMSSLPLTVRLEAK